MAEERRIRSLSIYNWIQTPKGAAGSTTLYTVPLDRELVVERVEVFFPVGCESQVEVALNQDGIQQFPFGGVYKGDDTTFASTARRTFPPGSSIIVKWKNNDTLNDLAFSVHLSVTEMAKVL